MSSFCWHSSPFVSYESSERSPYGCVNMSADAVLREGKHLIYLLSDHIRIMTCLNFEGTIIGPQIYRCCYTGDSSLENLKYVNLQLNAIQGVFHYHFSSFRASNGELQICILLPISKQERKFCEKAIVRISSCCNRLWTRVAI